MKRTNNLVPTLIALTAACTASQSVLAQSPARQAFPWSSASAVETASPTVSQTAARVSSSADHYSDANALTFGNSVSQSANNMIGSAASTADSAATIYLDVSGNEITREQMQANLSAGSNEVSLGLPSADQAVQSFEQNFEHNITQRRPVDNSIWDKSKTMTSKMTSKWKKPSLFKTPEGINLRSTKTTWAKPKFDEPTTWFSRRTTDPITFASIDSLPRKGKTPTSTDGPLASQAQLASRSAAPIAVPSLKPEKLENVRDAVSQSIFTGPEHEVAESVDNSFDPRR